MRKYKQIELERGKTHHNRKHRWKVGKTKTPKPIPKTNQPPKKKKQKVNSKQPPEYKNPPKGKKLDPKSALLCEGPNKDENSKNKQIKTRGRAADKNQLPKGKSTSKC